jgi:hypothetical protein
MEVVAMSRSASLTVERMTPADAGFMKKDPVVL